VAVSGVKSSLLNFGIIILTEKLILPFYGNSLYKKMDKQGGWTDMDAWTDWACLLSFPKPSRENPFPEPTIFQKRYTF
jgi:hypothetical protein